MIGFLDGWQESLLITVGQLIKFLASSPTCNPIDTLRLRWQEKQKYQATLKFSPKYRNASIYMKNKTGQKYQVVQIYSKKRSTPVTYNTAAQNDNVWS